MSRITLKDVAQQAGVSVASVSNVLNGRTNKVTPLTAQKIVDTAQQMGYTKNLAAASLKKGTSHSILVLMPQVNGADPDCNLLQDSPFFNDFLAGIEQGASTCRIPFSFLRVTSAAEVLAIKQGPAPLGVIVIGAFEDDIAQVIADWSFKTVIVDNDDFFHSHPVKPNLISSHIDDGQMGTLAIEHLVNLGHRNLVLVFAPVGGSIVHRERYRGINEFAQQHKDLNLTITLHESDIFFSHPENQFPPILNAIRQGATAVLCMSDIFAVSCYREALKSGLRVPEDFSLTGMDDLKILSFMPFKLTTISQHIAQRGYNAVMQIFDEDKMLPIELSVSVGETSRKI